MVDCKKGLSLSQITTKQNIMKTSNKLQIIFIIVLVGFILLGFYQQYFFLTREYNEYSFISKEQFYNTNFSNVLLILVFQTMCIFLAYILKSKK